MERTLVLIKPDAVQRGLIGEIISRYTRKGFKILALKMLKLDNKMASELYKPHIGKPFYEGLVAFMTSSPIIAMALEGPGLIKQIRAINGATNPQEALPGTIRGDFAQTISHNCVHASENEGDAKRELSVFFSDSDYLGYGLSIEEWL